MDIYARLTSKLHRLMAELPAYSARFDFGRLFTDAGRVLARAWLPIVIGVLVLGVAPVVLSAMPWWRAPPATTAETFRRVSTRVNLAKTLVTVVAHSAAMVYVAAASLTVLAGASWRETFQLRRLAAGFATSLCINLLGNWASFAGIVVASFAQDYRLLLILGLAGRLSALAVAAYLGIAPAAALAEQLFVGPAMARSFRLLRGLRWRMVGLGLTYLLVLGLAEYGLVLALSVASIPYQPPGLGRAVIEVAPVLVAAVTSAIFVSFFLQARRITDGPTASELHEVFA